MNTPLWWDAYTPPMVMIFWGKTPGQLSSGALRIRLASPVAGIGISFRAMQVYVPTIVKRRRTR